MVSRSPLPADPPPRGDARTAILNATLNLVRKQGWSATSVHQLCKAVGVTKGAFFHHFASKEHLGVAAARHWETVTAPLFADAQYHRHADPLDRIFGYLDFRAAIVDGPLENFTCFVGTTVQETFATSEAIRVACGDTINAHAERVAIDFRAALAQYPTLAPVTAEDLALYTQTVLQGGYVLSKARGDRAPLLKALTHLKRYIALLFKIPLKKEKDMARPDGSFIWYELMTTDSTAAARFYGAVIGWKITEQPAANGGQDYRMIVRSDGGNAGGVLKLTPEMQQNGARPIWLAYLHVENVDIAIKAIEADGGKMLMPKMSLPVGEIAMVADPMGTPFYLMNPIPPPGIPDAESEVFDPKASQRVRWNELLSSDLARAKNFYGKHFGFEFNESMPMGEMGDYCFIDHGGVRLGAIMQKPANVPVGIWNLYFGVDSVEAAKRAIESGGGKILMGPVEVPGGDWIVNALDPEGAPFGIVGPKSE
ncbi:MAG: VOC family protein [Steroidobacteraceae bacterium]